LLVCLLILSKQIQINQYVIYYKDAKAINVSKYIIDQCNEGELNKKDIAKQSILHLALGNSLCDISKMILAKFSFKLSSDINQNTEFHKWIYHSCKECLVLLLQKSGNSSRYKLRNSKKNSPLHLAVVENRIEAVKLFLQLCDFDLFEKGEEDMSLVELAIVYANEVLNNSFFISFI